MSSEFAIRTVVRTPSAEPMPSFVMKSRPKNARPLTEIATVSAGEDHGTARGRTRLGGGVARVESPRGGAAGTA